MRAGQLLQCGANMNREDCIVGSTVYTCDGLLYKYTVKSLPDNAGMIEVEPTEDSDGSCSELYIEEVYLYNEESLKLVGQKVQTELDNFKNLLEEGFAALARAQKIARDEGPGMYELDEHKLINISGLRNLEDYGWSSSSLWC